jgi:glutathione S-transferase
MINNVYRHDFSRCASTRMITLYQLHWSHFVEKARWALDHKGVEWSAVNVDPFTKDEMQHLQRKTGLVSDVQPSRVPTIHDTATNAVVADSSEILDYLERHYPSPALYPADLKEREEVARWMRWLDSTLGLAARRLAYTQIALEHPGLLAELMVPHMVGAGRGRNLKGRVAGAIIAGVLMRRFRFLHNRADRVFEQTEQCLLIAARRLATHDYLVGKRFTAADLTLAALLRPTTIVPFFRDHPRLQRLFDWRATQLREHRREPQICYETVLHDVRRRRGWALGAVGWLPASHRSNQDIVTEIPTDPVAGNDQQPVGRWPQLRGLFWYLRLWSTSSLARTPYS